MLGVRLLELGGAFWGRPGALKVLERSGDRVPIVALGVGSSHLRLPPIWSSPFRDTYIMVPGGGGGGEQIVQHGEKGAIP